MCSQILSLNFPGVSLMPRQNAGHRTKRKSHPSLTLRMLPRISLIMPGASGSAHSPGVICRGLLCSDMHTCARRAEAAVVGDVEVEVEKWRWWQQQQSRPLTVLQHHVCCVHLCAEERGDSGRGG